MKIERTACLVIPIPYEDDKPTPQEVDIEIRPKKYSGRQWIPNSMGDCVWLWYEFDTVDERDLFLYKIPGKYQDFITLQFKQEDLDRFEGVSGSDGGIY